MKRILFFTFIFALAFSFGATTAQSQDWVKRWTRSPIPDQADLEPPYFLNENLGFAFKGYAHYRTTDGGVHWTTIHINDSVSGLAPLTKVQDIYFDNESHGYLLAVDGLLGGNPGIYETIDTGTHWKLITKTGVDQFFFIYSSRNAVCAVSLDPLSRHWLVSRSTDDGNHWDTVLTTTNVGYTAQIRGNQDSIIYFQNVDSLNHTILNYSTNNGKIWSSSIIDSLGGSTNFYPFPHSRDILRTTIIDQSAGCLALEHSSDFGKTWEVYNPCLPVIGAIEGVRFGNNGCALYLWDTEDNGKPRGLFRSIDHGKTWNLIPGDELGNQESPTLCVTGCGAAVFAIGPDTGIAPKMFVLWRTIDGADGNMSSCSFTSSTHFTSARIINDSLNIIIHLPIYFHHIGTMSDVDMIINYPTQSLKYQNGISYNGKSIDLVGSKWAGRAALHFSAADLNAAPDSLIGYANFLWTPAENECSEVLFDSIDTHSSEAPCSQSSQAQPFKGIIGSFKTCGVSGVAEKNIVPPDFSIHPNPATKSIQVEITNSEIHLSFELFDALGIARKNGMTSDNSFQIDVSGLAAGNYYLRISGVGGVPVTKRVVIIK